MKNLTEYGYLTSFEGHDVIKQVLQEVYVSVSHRMDLKLGMAWIALDLHDGVFVAKPLTEIMSYGSLISSVARAKATPLPDITIGCKVTEISVDPDYENVESNRIYRLRGVRGQVCALTHGIVGIIFFFDSIEAEEA